MSDTLYAMPGGVFPHTGVDFTDDEGKLVKENSGALALNDSATVPARGVVLEGGTAAQNSSIGSLGLLEGAPRVKLGGAVAKFQQIQQKDDATLEADAGSGARVVVGFALEAGASGDLVKAVLFTPQVFSA